MSNYSKIAKDIYDDAEKLDVQEPNDVCKIAGILTRYDNLRKETFCELPYIYDHVNTDHDTKILDKESAKNFETAKGELKAFIIKHTPKEPDLKKDNQEEKTGSSEKEDSNPKQATCTLLSKITSKIIGAIIVGAALCTILGLNVKSCIQNESITPQINTSSYSQSLNENGSESENENESEHIAKNDSILRIAKKLLANANTIKPRDFNTTGLLIALINGYNEIASTIQQKNIEPYTERDRDSFESIGTHGVAKLQTIKRNLLFFSENCDTNKKAEKLLEEANSIKPRDFNTAGYLESLINGYNEIASMIQQKNIEPYTERDRDSFESIGTLGEAKLQTIKQNLEIYLNK